MLIEIKPEHIARGLRQQCDLCPLALALNEATGDQWVVSGAHYWRAANVQHLFKLSEAARTWVNDYDAKRIVTPVVFELGVL